MMNRTNKAPSPSAAGKVKVPAPNSVPGANQSSPPPDQPPGFKASQPGLLNPLPNALRLANKTSDYVVYILAWLALLLPGLLFSFISGQLWVNLLVMAMVMITVLITVRVMQVQLMSNSMRIQNSKYGYLRRDIDQISEALDLPPIDVFVIQNPFLNAFALGFVGPYAIALHSATLEQLSYDEMRAILFHEIAHIKYGHTRMGIYINGLMILPWVGPMVSWVFGFWSRRAEWTCDRFSAAYTGQPDTIIDALIKIHVGPKSGAMTSKEYLMYQDNVSQGLLRRFSQSFSTHPYLVNRIKSILRFADAQGYAMAPDLQQYIRTHPKS